ncbi:T9SS type A sorting domain-containing protein [Flavobacterium salilacus subsp. salilacus]|uniref:T9SS type A sorting domain-containing protein n=1 Tax=Flavobacterium TaxID=237 RepID=UPI001074E074|nr:MULTISPECIES: T9SS type A sorting domain-containing protein [Flavobacterium]KAF2520083.1 T9SS type A sorting domain-containing protein [Flavobacterium salilacus subsp. salilacus]MBE1614001.1 T9SS type A sorting domain-containing protein [Flavobacterium sp. SaA2.13]
MKKIITKAAFSFIALTFAFIGNAQEKQGKKARIFGKGITEVKRCGTTEYEALLQQKYPKRATTEKFEQWLAPKVNAIKTQRLASSGVTPPSTNVVVTIPVVVHVIHNGDPIGTDENLATAQILSQITVLNQDFRRKINTPGYNTNPVGADMEIEFCLAQRDPDGIATTGIVRYNLGGNDGWDIEDIESTLKPQTQWDPEQYLNIWIVDYMYVFGGELAGYAQFPTNSGLEGIDGLGQADAAETDGVVVGHRYFGSSDIYPEGTYDSEGRDKGRTSSHEIGHFFGLRHIWGDGDCSADDFCADTPVAAGPNQGCPSGTDSCPSSPGNDMIENYMDYTDDVCQNIFTVNQKDRMAAVLLNSPRRVSLITSLGCVPGMVYELDGSLDMNGIQNTACNNIITPSVILTNTGNAPITSATISYNMDNEETAEYNWEGNLANNEDVTIELPAYTLTSGQHTFTATLTAVNETTDDINTNNTATGSFDIANSFDTEQIIVTVMTDGFGDETVWALLDSNDEPIVSNINLNDPFNSEFYGNNQLYTQTINVENNQCYSFAILDFEGDGICCEYGNGYYTVTTPNGDIIAQGGDFTDSETTPFGINTILSDNTPVNSAKTIKLYPNPANSVINIAVSESASLPESYSIYNSLGQLVGNGIITSANTNVNISNYADGMYFIKVNKGSTETTLRFIKY